MKKQRLQTFTESLISEEKSEDQKLFDKVAYYSMELEDMDEDEASEVIPKGTNEDILDWLAGDNPGFEEQFKKNPDKYRKDLMKLKRAMDKI